MELAVHAAEAADGSYIFRNPMLEQSQITLARSNERSARRTLEEGCASDMASIERLLASALAWARHEVATAPDTDAAQRIAAECVERVSDTANIRFRARFRSYAETVWESETRLAAKPRRVSLPRLHLSSPLVPFDDDIDHWIAALTSTLCRELQRALDVAQDKVVRRVIASIARARAARDLRSR